MLPAAASILLASGCYRGGNQNCNANGSGLSIFKSAYPLQRALHAYHLQILFADAATGRALNGMGLCKNRFFHFS